MSSPLPISALLIAETGAALLLTATSFGEDREWWLPKAQLTDIDRLEIPEGTLITARAPDWLIQEKSCQPLVTETTLPDQTAELPFQSS